MKLSNCLLFGLLVWLVLLEGGEARRQMKGGKASTLRRSKRTIGDIINWKLGLLQNIFDGITGFFGGGGNGGSSSSSSYGAPSSSYGAPSSSYGAPSYKAPRPNNNGGGKGNKGGSGFKLPRIPLKGLFSAFKGGNKGNNGGGGGGGYGAPPSRPSYNAPSGGNSYNAPSGGNSYNAPTVNQNFAAPSQGYNSGGSGGQASYGGGGFNNGGGFPQGPPRQPNPNDFGPSNAIKMLPAPNLATGRPPAGFGGSGSGYNNGGGNFGGNQGYNNGGGNFGGNQGSGFGGGQAANQAIDSYGAPEAAPIDSYGAPQADPIDSYGAPEAAPLDSYGAPQAPPVAAPAEDSYGAPQAPPVAAPAEDSYGAPQAAPVAAPASDSYGSPQAAPIAGSQAAAPVAAPDSYGSPRGPPVGAGSGFNEAKQLPDTFSGNAAEAQDSYGAAVAAPISNQAAVGGPIGSSVGGRVNDNAAAPDSYGSPVSPVLAPESSAAAAPVSAPDSYGNPVSPVLPATGSLPSVGKNPSVSTGSGPNPGPIDAVIVDARDGDEALIQSTLQQANFLPAGFEEVSGRSPAVSTDADPVDVYGSALAPVGTSAPVPEEIFKDSSEPTSFDSYGRPVEKTESVDLTGDSRVEDVTVQDPEVIDMTDKSLAGADVTAAPGPVLFTYAPTTEKETKALADPLNVIPDDYEYSDYDDEYDPNDIPADQAAPLPGYGGDEDLDSYGESENSLDSYGGGGRDVSVNPPLLTTPPPLLTTPAPEITGFTDLRSLQFTTGAPLEEVEEEYEDEEPEITTYSPPIDFKLGTTASDGIVAGEVQYEDEPDLTPIADIYDNEYEEPETNYNPEINIPLQVETDELSAELPNYNEPVVLLLGTPDQEVDELDSYTGAAALRAKVSRKRSPDPKVLRQKYNNWFNRANDWSQKISSRIHSRNSLYDPNAGTYFFK